MNERFSFAPTMLPRLYTVSKMSSGSVSVHEPHDDDEPGANGAKDTGREYGDEKAQKLTKTLHHVNKRPLLFLRANLKSGCQQGYKNQNYGVFAPVKYFDF